MSTRKKDDAEIQQYKTMLLNVVECIQYKESPGLSVSDENTRKQNIDEFKGRLKCDIEKTIHSKTKTTLMAQKQVLERRIAVAMSDYKVVTTSNAVESISTILIWEIIRNHIKKSQKYWLYVHQFDTIKSYTAFAEYKNIVINYDNIQKHLKSLLREENVGGDLQSSNRVSKSRKQNKVQEDKS